jgi:FdhD protein
MVGDMKSVSLPPVTVKVSVRKLELSLNLDENVEDDVAVESPIEIILNGKSIATLLATPSLIEELAIGFLLDEGIVDSKDDLVSVRAIGKTVDVETKERGVRYEKSRNTGLVLTSCGSSGYSKSLDGLDWPSVCSDHKVKAQDISKMIRELSQSSLYFGKTGAMHSAAIFHNSILKAFAEDVGRHNAIDKVIGSSIRQGLDLTQATLATTGRQPADLVLKAARVGVPISVSMRGPIHSGILAAEKVGLTLVCFARGSRMNVYTFPERIVH